jgi:hypothetical protein
MQLSAIKNRLKRIANRRPIRLAVATSAVVVCLPSSPGRDPGEGDFPRIVRTPASTLIIYQGEAPSDAEVLHMIGRAP